MKQDHPISNSASRLATALFGITVFFLTEIKAGAGEKRKRPDSRSKAFSSNTAPAGSTNTLHVLESQAGCPRRFLKPVDGDVFFRQGILAYKNTNDPKRYEKAKACFEKATCFGHGESFHWLGIIYHLGKGVDADPKAALRFYKKGAESKVSRSFYNMGLIYKQGHGVPVQPLIAREHFEKAADLGHAGSLYELANAYKTGHMVDFDLNKAREYYEMAAAKNHGPSFLQLGIIYNIGAGAEMDYVKARYYYEKAAENGTVEANHPLGELYRLGKGVPVDFVQARTFYEKSAEQNHIISLIKLGTLYKQGKGTPINYKKAFELYDQAAMLASPLLKNLEHVCGAEQDNQTSCEPSQQYRMKAVRLGIPELLYHRGEMYQFGLGIIRNEQVARTLIEKSAALGSVEAMYSLGMTYFYGQGVEVDYIKARSYIEPAARKGSADALFKLGQMFDEGLGVPVDSKTAGRLYQIAARKGHAQAGYIARILQKGSAETQCPICLCPLAASKVNTVLTPCGHAFHYTCLREGDRKKRQDRCPTCNVPM